MNNPYVKLINTIIVEVQGWIYYLIGGVAIVVLLINGVKYLQGNQQDKSAAVAAMRNTIYMAGGVYFLVWLVTEIVKRFSAIK